MNERVDQAKRLELSEVQDVGDFVSGRARGLHVSLEGAAPFTACTVELGAAIPISRMRMQPGDLNVPDAVETGDGEFDERMQVTSLATYAPTLQQLLADSTLRAALLRYFSKYPEAQFVGTKLRVPAGEEGVTQRLIVDALEVCELMVRRFAEIGFLSSEPRVALPPGMRPVPWGRIALGAGTAGLTWTVLSQAIGLIGDPVFFIFGAMMVGLGAVVGGTVGESDAGKK